MITSAGRSGVERLDNEIGDDLWGAGIFLFYGGDFWIAFTRPA